MDPPVNRPTPTSESQPKEKAPGGSKLRQFALNLLLVVLSTILGYVALEFVFFVVLLPNYNFGIRPHLPETAEVLVQGSKSKWVPHDYVALLGDSNAEGVGDWLISNGGNEALPFGPADVLHLLTGRDVVSFGRGGIGSAESLVRQPAQILAGSDCMIFSHIDPPSRILAFFSEGFGIQSNLVFLKKVTEKYGSDDVQAIDRYLSDVYADFPSWQCHLYLGDTIGRLVRFAYEYRNFTINDLKPSQPGGNIIIVNGRTIDAPSPLMGPALEIDETGTQAAIKVFDQSLAWLRNRYPHVTMTVVDIPSPLTAYHLSGTVTYRIEPEEAGLSAQTSPETVSRNSNRLCNLIRTVASNRGVGFIDARPTLRAAAATAPIHGPVDWTHLNETGYRALAGMLAARLDERQSDDTCN